MIENWGTTCKRKEAQLEEKAGSTKLLLPLLLQDVQIHLVLYVAQIILFFRSNSLQGILEVVALLDNRFDFGLGHSSHLRKSLKISGNGQIGNQYRREDLELLQLFEVRNHTLQKGVHNVRHLCLLSFKSSSCLLIRTALGFVI